MADLEGAQFGEDEAACLECPPELRPRVSVVCQRCAFPGPVGGRRAYPPNSGCASAWSAAGANGGKRGGRPLHSLTLTCRRGAHRRLFRGTRPRLCRCPRRGAPAGRLVGGSRGRQNMTPPPDETGRRWPRPTGSAAAYATLLRVSGSSPSSARVIHANRPSRPCVSAAARRLPGGCVLNIAAAPLRGQPSGGRLRRLAPLTRQDFPPECLASKPAPFLPSDSRHEGRSGRPTMAFFRH